MKRRKGIRCELLALLLGFACLFTSTMPAKVKNQSGLTANEARNLISSFAGASLSKKSIHIKEIAASDGSNLMVIADVKLTFRLVGEENQPERVAEIRAGDNRWEDVRSALEEGNTDTALGSCEPREDTPSQTTAKLAQVKAPGKNQDKNNDKEKQRAKCAIATFFVEPAQSDAVIVKEISPLDIPLSPTLSSVVEAEVALEFLFAKLSNGRWGISKLRIQGGKWRDTSPILQSFYGKKIVRARSELQEIAKALASFKLERGFFPISDSEATLIDQLNPRYLKDVIRVDPWHRPYQYSGTEGHYVLRSAGPDGKFDTPDDLVVGG